MSPPAPGSRSSAAAALERPLLEVLGPWRWSDRCGSWRQGHLGSLFRSDLGTQSMGHVFSRIGLRHQQRPVGQTNCEKSQGFPLALDGASAVAPRCRVARPGSGARGWDPGFVLLWVCPDGVLRGRAQTALAGMSTSPGVLARRAVGTAPSCPPVGDVGVVRGTPHRLRATRPASEVTALGVTCHPRDTPGVVVGKAAPWPQSGGGEAGMYSSPGAQSQERQPEPPRSRGRAHAPLSPCP